MKKLTQKIRYFLNTYFSGSQIESKIRLINVNSSQTIHNSHFHLFIRSEEKFQFWLSFQKFVMFTAGQNEVQSSGFVKLPCAIKNCARDKTWTLYASVTLWNILLHCFEGWHKILFSRIFHNTGESPWHSGYHAW